MIVVIVEAEIERPAVKLINPVYHSFSKFRCDQCTFTNMTQKHVRMKHRLFQVMIILTWKEKIQKKLILFPLY